MKKPQTFLGASAFILAIAGAMATKASHRGVCITYGTKFFNDMRCHLKGCAAIYTTIYSPGVNNRAHTAIWNVKTLYTAVSNGVGNTHCGKTLYTQSTL